MSVACDVGGGACCVLACVCHHSVPAEWTGVALRVLILFVAHPQLQRAAANRAMDEGEESESERQDAADEEGESPKPRQRP